MKTDLHKKKVLHIIDSFGTGGAETWLLECVKYLYQNHEMNVQFDFIASGGKTGLYDEEIKKYGSNIFYIKYSLQKIFTFGHEFKKILKVHKYCAIHNHTDFVSGWHFLSAAGSLPAIRISHVHNPWNFVHNYVVNPFRWFSFRMGRLLTALFATKITGTSVAVMDEYGYNKWPFKKKRILPAYCGFEVKKFRYNENAKKKICSEFSWQFESSIALFAGRIGLHEYDAANNQKNPAFAFDIAKKLVQEYDSWHFIFAGYKGKLGEVMEQEIQQAGLENRIKFLGVRKDIPELMSSADVLIFPSLWEGLGMVAVEAQACGLNVVASSSVPKEAFIIPELITMKDLSDAQQDWINAISQINKNKPKNRTDYNVSIQKSVFSIESSVHNLLMLYQ